MTSQPFNETFTKFVQTTPATFTINDVDEIPIIQNGITRHISPRLIAGVPQVALITAGTTYTVTAIGNICIGVDKAAGSATEIVMPRVGAFTGQYVEVADILGDANINNITIDGSLFDNFVNYLVITQPLGVIGLRWYGTYWKIV